MLDGTALPLPATNDHEYDDDRYAEQVGRLQSAIYALWEAGASADNIASEIENACENVA